MILLIQHVIENCTSMNVLLHTSTQHRKSRKLVFKEYSKTQKFVKNEQQDVTTKISAVD